jgi:tetratricopeptide (TPR) repeat protein
VDFAKRYGRSENNRQGFRLLEEEWANILEAADLLWHSAAQVEGDGRRDAALRCNDLTRSLQQFLLLDGRWDEQLRLSARVYKLMVGEGEWVEAGWRAYQAFQVYYHRADAPELKEWAERCADAWSRVSNVRDQAFGKYVLGLAARRTGDYATARMLFQEALSIYRSWGDDQHFTGGADRAKGLQAAAHEIPEQCDRARPSFHQKEGASIAMLQEFSHC